MTGRKAAGGGSGSGGGTTTTTTTTMSRSVLQPSQQKLAEKLTILNDRGVGMLTRLYNIKKVRTGRRGRGGGDGRAEEGRAAGENPGWGQRAAPTAEITAMPSQARPGVAEMRRGLMRSPAASPRDWRPAGGREKPFPRSQRWDLAGPAQGAGRLCRPLLCAPAPGTGSTGKGGWRVGKMGTGRA